MNGNFTRSGLKHKALYFNYISDIPSLKLGKSLFADIVHSNISLNSAVSVLNVDKVSLTHITPGHYSACYDNIFIFKIFKISLDFI